jgi:ribosomal protein S18 acetylase RimI-like enzyme
MLKSSCSSFFFVQTIHSSADWQWFEDLLRTYANTDLDEPKLSTIWKDLENLQSRYAPPVGASVLLRFQDGLADQVVGCGAITKTDSPNICEIKRLYIQPNFRGRGGSKVLIRALLQKAQQDGYDQAVLSTWQSNLTGLALYKSMGFVTVPSFKHHPNQQLIYLGRPLHGGLAQALS